MGTITIKRANVVLHVDEADINHYLELGYSVIDERGKVIKEAVPTDLKFLQTAYVKQKEEIASLKAEVDKLNLKLAEKKATATEEAPKETKRRTKKDE